MKFMVVQGIFFNIYGSFLILKSIGETFTTNGKRQIQIENFNRNKQIKQSKTIPVHKPKEELLIFLET